MLKLSERLAAVAFLAGNGGVLADVGTDHGYVPVYLVSEGNFPRAIAMDVNQGPLKSAAAHIVMYGMGDYIQTRLSDGVAALSEGEADTILIAGMGGGLIMRILREGQTVCRSARKLVLQPQSELPSVRRFLLEQGYVTDAANMIREGGKYYPMMRVHYEPSGVSSEGACMELYCRYGRELLLQKNEVLGDYLVKERGVYEKIRLQLSAQKPRETGTGQRIREVEEVLRLNEAARGLMRR